MLWNTKKEEELKSFYHIEQHLLEFKSFNQTEDPCFHLNEQKSHSHFSKVCVCVTTSFHYMLHICITLLETCDVCMTTDSPSRVGDVLSSPPGGVTLDVSAVTAALSTSQYTVQQVRHAVLTYFSHTSESRGKH